MVTVFTQTLKGEAVLLVFMTPLFSLGNAWELCCPGGCSSSLSTEQNDELPGAERRCFFLCVLCLHPALWHHIWSVLSPELLNGSLQYCTKCSSPTRLTMEDICTKRKENWKYSVPKQTEKSYVSKQDSLIGHTGIFKDIKSPLIQYSQKTQKLL